MPYETGQAVSNLLALRQELQGTSRIVGLRLNMRNMVLLRWVTDRAAKELDDARFNDHDVPIPPPEPLALDGGPIPVHVDRTLSDDVILVEHPDGTTPLAWRPLSVEGVAR